MYPEMVAPLEWRNKRDLVPVRRNGDPNRLRQSLAVRVRYRADHLSLAIENEDLAGVGR